MTFTIERIIQDSFKIRLELSSTEPNFERTQMEFPRGARDEFYEGQRITLDVA